MQHAHYFCNDGQTRVRHFQPHIEGSDQLRAYVLAWMAVQVVKRAQQDALLLRRPRRDLLVNELVAKVPRRLKRAVPFYGLLVSAQRFGREGRRQALWPARLPRRGHGHLRRSLLAGRLALCGRGGRGGGGGPSYGGLELCMRGGKVSTLRFEGEARRTSSGTAAIAQRPAHIIVRVRVRIRVRVRLCLRRRAGHSLCCCSRREGARAWRTRGAWGKARHVCVGGVVDDEECGAGGRLAPVRGRARRDVREDLVLEGKRRRGGHGGWGAVARSPYKKPGQGNARQGRCRSGTLRI